jgi:2-polyprenyl-3-methyl-5-hydroxy-6-metoxy-1,4-benzoquinol methylase
MDRNKKHTCGIYQILNSINGKRYIGFSINIENRWRKHKRVLNKGCHDNSYLQRAWNYYGMENFIFEIIQELSPDEEILKLMEIYWIAYYNSFKGDGGGYNLTRGGDGSLGSTHSEESKLKMSVNRKGKGTGKNNPMYKRHHSEESKKKMSLAHSGKKLSDEHKKNISISLIGENSPNYGKHLSEATREKMSLNHADFKKEKNPMYNKRLSLEQKNNMSNIRKIWWKNKKGEDKKIMNQLEFGQYRNIDGSFKPEFYDEDYYENGKESKKGWLESYHWMPIRSFHEALAFVDCLNLNEESRVLDFGGSKGFVVKALRILGIKSDVADISRYALKFAPKGSWNSLIEKNWKNHYNAYTNIIVKDVFEHLTPIQLGKILNKLSYLAPKIMCVVPMGDSGKYRIPEYHIEISHLIAENEEWWMNKFEENGWIIKNYYHHIKGIKDNWSYIPDGNCVFILEKKV